MSAVHSRNGNIARLHGATHTDAAAQNAFQIPDLSILDTRGIIKWAEKVQHTPGVVMGDRRRAAGMRLIIAGLDILKGNISSRRDLDLSGMTTYFVE